MITPPYLKKGDKVGIIAPSGKIEKHYISNAIDILNSWGLEVVIGQHVNKSFLYFAGKDHERAEDLQNMLDDQTIRAVFCARGGYGLVRIWNKIDLDGFKKHPKWIVGYSDITVLHNLIRIKTNTQTIHATMPINYPESNKAMNNKNLVSLKKMLWGQKMQYNTIANQFNRYGYADGILTGGNLSVLYSLMGTPLEQEKENIVLFLEDTNEYLYHIDRMIMSFYHAGFFEKIKALIVGGMNNMKGKEYGHNTYQIISAALHLYNYPVIFDFPAGHIDNNYAMRFGSKIQLQVSESGGNIVF
jgi:muramoyltetrapeptide carboxypeptidase